MSEITGRILRRLTDLEAQRTTYEPTWDDICRYIQLSNKTIYDENPKGDNKNADVAFDSTASYAAQRLGAVINSVMTNQASEWFMLETDNEELNDVKEVKEWLEDTTKTIRKELENSNFYTELLPLYYDLATIGTACMYIEGDASADRELRFSTRHIKEVYIDEDLYGQVDTVYRKTKMTARQMVQRWDEDVCERVKAVVTDKPDTEFEVVHACFPRAERDVTKKIPTEMKYASIWIDKDNKHLLSEGGYEEFPYVVPRWDKLSGETYGRSPSYIALPDVKTLNAMMATLLKISQKAADPAMFQSGDLEGTLDMSPGAVNVADGAETTLTPLNTGVNPPLTIQVIQMKIDRLLEIYYNNQLQVIQGKQMTAAEVQARTDENWRILGAVFGRLQSELLEKLMARVFNIVGKSTRPDGNPLLTVPPEQMGDASLRLNYVSQLAKAQKQTDIMGIVNTISYTMELSQAVPGAMENIDFDAAVRALAELYGAPPEILMDRQQMAQMRQARAQQQQQMMQAQQDAQQIDNVKNEAMAGKTIKEAQQIGEETA